MRGFAIHLAFLTTGVGAGSGHASAVQSEALPPPAFGPRVGQGGALSDPLGFLHSWNVLWG